MAAMIALGMSFLLFFVITGLMWTIGVHVLIRLIEALPVLSGPWGSIQTETHDNLKLIFTFLPGVLFLFASLKMAINAGNRGAD